MLGEPAVPIVSWTGGGSVLGEQAVDRFTIHRDNMKYIILFVICVQVTRSVPLVRQDHNATDTPDQSPLHQPVSLKKTAQPLMQR